MRRYRDWEMQQDQAAARTHDSLIMATLVKNFGAMEGTITLIFGSRRLFGLLLGLIISLIALVTLLILNG